MPRFWRWVGIGALLALAVVWVAQSVVPAAGFAGGIGRWTGPGVTGPAEHARVRQAPTMTRRTAACQPAALGSTVIVQGPRGTQRIVVGPGQTVTVDQSGAVQVSAPSSTTACQTGPGAQGGQSPAQSGALDGRLQVAPAPSELPLPLAPGTQS